MPSKQATSHKPVTVDTLTRMKQDGEKFACLTCYDASFAQLLEDAGVDVLLVGDSLGMVLQGHDTTLPVVVADMIYHAACVSRRATRALRVVDLPFMSYSSRDQALDNSARLMREGGAQMVKPEGGAVIVDTVGYLTKYGVPVCGHLGLLPQSVHKLGGYRVQGRDKATADAILQDAKALEQAGASMLVLECIPSELAQKITKTLVIPTIGIGAGPHCDGQVLVLYDMLGVTPGKRLKFSKDFLAGAGSVVDAVRAYVDAVKSGTFPSAEHEM